MIKILSDPRRSRILQLAADKPATVKMLAEQMGEDPLRLYYHVKKLVKAELLELKESRQQGNLTEHYYQTADLNDVIYRGNAEENAQHLETIVAFVHRKLEPGLRLLQKGLEKIREESPSGAKFERNPYHVNVLNVDSRCTGREWQESMDRIVQAINNTQEPIERKWASDGREDEIGSYHYVVVSYRIEDAEKLGLIEPSEEEPEEED
nr:winged helix-turn-helix domain-containing protein [Cohnella lubricantis]